MTVHDLQVLLLGFSLGWGGAVLLWGIARWRGSVAAERAVRRAQARLAERVRQRGESTTVPPTTDETEAP